jgi:flagellar biosynthetic protein FliP
MKRMFLEMLVAMAVGMVVLDQVWAWTFDGLGWPGILDRPDVHAMVMAADMSVAMVLWMRLRSRTWAGAGLITASMFVPFVVLLVPFWAGALSGEAMLMAGHVLMLPCMAVAMVRGHRAGHTGHAHHQAR